MSARHIGGWTCTSGGGCRRPCGLYAAIMAARICSMISYILVLPVLLFLLCSFLCFLLFTFTAGGFFSRFSIGAQFCGQLRVRRTLFMFKR